MRPTSIASGSLPLNDKGEFFGIIGANVDGVARAISARGYKSHIWNSRYGERYDLNRRSAIRHFLRDLRSGRMLGVFFERSHLDDTTIVKVLKHVNLYGVPWMMMQPTGSVSADFTQVFEGCPFGYERELAHVCAFWRAQSQVL